MSTDIQEFMKNCFAKLKDKFPVNKRPSKEKSLKDVRLSIKNYLD